MYRPWPLRLLPRHRRIMRSGAVAKAVVLASQPWGYVSGVVKPNNKLKLKVHFDDDSTATVTRVERTHYLGMYESVGSIVPIRYDPADPSYLDIDRAELLRIRARNEQQADQRLIQDAEEELRRHQD